MSLQKFKGRRIEVTKGEPYPTAVTIRIKQCIGDKVFILSTQVSSERELPRLLVSYGKKYKIRKDSIFYIEPKKEEPEEKVEVKKDIVEKPKKPRTTRKRKPRSTNASQRSK